MLGSSSWMPYAAQGVKGTDDDLTHEQIVNTMCGSDEHHPYPVRSFTYRNEQVRSDEVQKVILYITKFL